MWTPWLPGVPTGGIPIAFSTPRPVERQVSGGPLLASAPDGLSPINHDETSLRTVDVARCPRRTRLLRWLSGPRPVDRTPTGFGPRWRPYYGLWAGP